MDTTRVENMGELTVFRKDGKGNIKFLGSGRYFREQKERYSGYTEPFQQLYKEQVQAILKDSSEDIQSVFCIV